MTKRFQVSNDIVSAETLSSSFYTDENVFKSSKETIFSGSWQLISHKQNLKNKTQFPFLYLDGFMNEPLVLIHQNDNLTCYSNVCTHRAHLVSLEKCNKSVLRCRYHGRTFELDGKMKVMPGFEEVKNFPTKKDNLQTTPTLFWRDFIFVSCISSILKFSSVAKLDCISDTICVARFTRGSSAKSFTICYFNTFSINIISFK